MKNSNEELIVLLNAIRDARSNWLKKVDSEVDQKVSEDPKLSKVKAFENVIATKEIFEDFDRVLTLYSVLGSSLDGYLETLKKAS